MPRVGLGPNRSFLQRDRKPPWSHRAIWRQGPLTSCRRLARSSGLLAVNSLRCRRCHFANAPGPARRHLHRTGHIAVGAHIPDELTENKVSLGCVELNNKIRVFQRRAYGLRHEEYLRLKVLTCMLDPL